MFLLVLGVASVIYRTVENHNSTLTAIELSPVWNYGEH